MKHSITVKYEYMDNIHIKEMNNNTEQNTNHHSNQNIDDNVDFLKTETILADALSTIQSYPFESQQKMKEIVQTFDKLKKLTEITDQRAKIQQQKLCMQCLWQEIQIESDRNSEHQRIEETKNDSLKQVCLRFIDLENKKLLNWQCMI